MHMAFFVAILVVQFVNLHSRWPGTVMHIGLGLELSFVTNATMLKLKVEGRGRIIRLPSLLLILFGFWVTVE